MKRRALATKNLPRSINLAWYATVWLLMDRINPAAWIWGVVGTLVAIVAIVNLVDVFSAEDVEI